jgi:hypothetical protein
MVRGLEPNDAVSVVFWIDCILVCAFSFGRFDAINRLSLIFLQSQFLGYGLAAEAALCPSAVVKKPITCMRDI